MGYGGYSVCHLSSYQSRRGGKRERTSFEHVMGNMIRMHGYGSEEVGQAR